MGLFDFLFGNKKEKERLEKERLAEQERIRIAEEKRIAEERERRLLEKKKEAERLGRLEVEKKTKQEAERKAQLESKEKIRKAAEVNVNKNDSHIYTTSSFNSNSDILLTPYVDKCISLADSSNKLDLQNALYELYKFFNKPGGGRLITTYPNKHKLGECFTFMLQNDWMNDEDIREVWVENGFYAFITHIATEKGATEMSQSEHMFSLLLLLCFGRTSLEAKVQDILNKGRIVHESVFSNNDYNKGAKYVISQFSFMAAYGARPLIMSTPQLMMHFCTKYPEFNTYFKETLSNEDEFLQLNPLDIFAKAKFISKIIESILNDM